jgi:hypothetical protein
MRITIDLIVHAPELEAKLETLIWQGERIMLDTSKMLAAVNQLGEDEPPEADWEPVLTWY